MAGWISIVGSTTDFGIRLKRFKRIFSVNGVPNLNIETYSDFADLNIVAWAWNDRNIPDLCVKLHKEIVLIFAGVITDVGNLPIVKPGETNFVDNLVDIWIEEGEKIISELNGSFSLFFFNVKTKQISVFTDRFASRSVWFGDDKKNRIFSNFPSAVAAFMLDSPSLDPAGLWSLFHVGRQVADHSLYSNVKCLLAGQQGKFSLDSMPRVNNWWRRKYNPIYGVPPKEWGARLADGLGQSVQRNKRVTENPHLFLSGGLDSRIVSAAYRKTLKTITLCTHPNAETRIASMVTRILGQKHQVMVRSPYWNLDTTDASSLISSGIYLNSHTHFIVPAKKIISDNQKPAFLLGDLMENFSKHYFLAPNIELTEFRSDKIEQILYTCVPYTTKYSNHLGRYFNKSYRNLFESSYSELIKTYSDELKEISNKNADKLDTFLRWSNVAITPTYNMTTCLWPFSEVRNLYFDNDLDNISLQIPSEVREAGVLHKWILYHLNKSLIFIPDANTFLPPILPKNVSSAAKKIRPMLGKIRRGVRNKEQRLVLRTSGSWLLLHEMYRKDPLYRNHIEEMISDMNIFLPEIFDHTAIKKSWDEYLAGNINLHFDIEAIRSFGCLQRLIPCRDISH